MAVVAYNHERWIEQAVRAALAQSYSPLQIILSDDASADSTFAIMSELAAGYAGPHQILLNRNSRNLGLALHLNRIAELASGEIIVLAAGDDVSLSHRVASLVDRFAADRTIMAALSGYTEVKDHAPVLTVRLPRDFAAFTEVDALARTGGWVGMGATFAYARACFTTPADLPAELISEDRLLPFRAALLGRIAFIAEPLVLYRVHEDSATAVGGFRSAAYESKHQGMLLNELEWARTVKLVEPRAYRRIRRALENYPRHFKTASRLASVPSLARIYFAFYNAALWRRRIALRFAARVTDRSVVRTTRFRGR